MSYAQVPGVRDKSGSGIGRLGSEFPVLGSAFSADVLHDMIEVDCL